MFRTRGHVRASATLASMCLAAFAALAAPADGAEHARAHREPASPRLAGLLPYTPEVQACWTGSGAWMFPVGDSLDFQRPVGSTPGYRILRGVVPRVRGAEPSARDTVPHARATEPHDGADIANGLAGGRVRASACGVIVSVEYASRGGYGSRIVIAHRVENGSIVYTVYAHLARRSARGVEGASVAAGEPIGRVGQTGRATTPHLHFEVRVPKDSTLRWEKCPVVDPIAFVRNRLPAARADSDWAAPYMAWAERAALLPHGVDAMAPLDAVMLQQVLECAGLPAESPGRDPARKPHRGDHEPFGWSAIVRSLTALEMRASRLPPCPVEPHRLAETCIRRLGVRRPAHELHRLAGRDQAPTIGELCLALADFAVRAPHRRR